jgi:hypothetical protein
LNPCEIWTVVVPFLAIRFFFRKVERMRANIQLGGRNFAEVVFHAYYSGSVPDCHETVTELSEKKAKGFEAVPLITAKYQILNGTGPAFFAGTGTLQGY